jgi:cell division protein FtsZ
MIMSLEFDFRKRKGSIIKVVGVGGGGGNAVANMFNHGITGVDFAVCNTDIQALDNNPVDVKIQLGPHLTDGRGAGSKPEVGKQACLESIDDIKEFLDDGTKMLFVTAGMGGGTGTGAAPIVAKAAKEMGILTVAIVTLPFKFEGNRRQRFAAEGLEELKANVDAYLVISNDRLSELHGNLALSAAFNEADTILTTAAKGIAEIITVPGYINVDFEDVNTVMRGSGIAIMGSAVSEGEDRARRAIDAAMNSPLLEENDIRGAQHILLNISSGKKEVTMHEVSEITDYVQEEAGYGTNIIWGNCQDDSLGEKLCVTLIATGFRSTQATQAKAEAVKKVRIPLDDSMIIEDENPSVVNVARPQESNTIDFEEDEVRQTIEALNRDLAFEKRDIPPVGKDPMAEKYQNSVRKLEDARRSYMRNTIAPNFDNPKAINDMENEPAYKRRNVNLEDVKEMRGATKMSRFEIGPDSDHPLRESNNSFLHENVD